MRRNGGGYPHQSGGILHNGPRPHGSHQHQSQSPGRIGINRPYNHQHHPNLQTLHGLQNIQNMPNQQSQSVPYGHSHMHSNSFRSLPFPSPPLPTTVNLLNSNQHSGVSGGGLQGLVPLSTGGYALPNNASSGGNTSSSSPIGGDMPPVETVVARLETACRLLHGVGGNNTRVNEIGMEIQILSEDLRRVGPLLETAYPDVLDRVMSSMRDASAQPSLHPSLRLAIFELVELRASKWMLPSDSSNYYRQRRNINEAADLTAEGPISYNYNSSSPNPLASAPRPITVTKPDVVYQSERSPPLGASPIPSNSTTSETSNSAKGFREEIIIKNSDSGKVSPSAKERVLSINGYSQQSITLAKQLIQETIQRNSSPVFEGVVSNAGAEIEEGLDPSSMAGLKKLNSDKLDDILPRFCYSVSLGDDAIRITGTSLQFVQEAKFALDDYFSLKYPELFYASNDVEDDEISEPDGAQSDVPKYDRSTLLSLSLRSTLPIPNFQHLEPEIRNSIILEQPRRFDPEKFCRDIALGITCNVDNAQ